jgi:DNA polymerase-3 subunit epsilon
MQIAGILEVNGKEVDSFSFNGRPDPDIKIDDYVLKIQGKSIEQLQAYPERPVMFKNFLAKLDEYVDRYDALDKLILAGYNVEFDKRMLFSMFNQNKNRYAMSYFMTQGLDVMQLAFLFFLNGSLKVNNMKLNTVCKACNIVLNEAHDACADIRATKDLFYYFNNRFEIKGV